MPRRAVAPPRHAPAQSAPAAAPGSGPAPPRERPRASVLLQRATEGLRKAFLAQVLGRAPPANTVRAALLEALYRQEPLLRRGIRKHAGDAVKHWLELAQPADIEPHPGDAAFQAWARRTRLRAKLKASLVSAHLLGDGYLEVEYADGGASTDPAPEGARPVDVHVVDPEHVWLVPARDVGAEAYWLHQEIPGLPPVTLHPDRYLHVALERLPGEIHGLSTVEAAWHAASSKVKGDQGLGEVLYRAGQPLRHWSVAEGSPDDVAAVAEMLHDPRFQHAVVWTDQLTGQQFNPTAVDPAPYYDKLLESVAAAVGVPKMVLVGAQAGAVTGSETNLEDYHGDLAETQEVTLSPAVEALASRLLGEPPEAFDVRWRPFPGRRDAEAQGVRDRVMAFQGLVAAGVLPVSAARIAGLDLADDDFQPRPAGVLPPGGGPLRPADADAEGDGANDDDDDDDAEDGGGGEGSP